MIHLRLIKGRTYLGAVRASADKPNVYLEDDESAIAEKLVKSGFFIVVEDNANREVSQEEAEEEELEGEKNPLINELQTMTKAELIKRADKYGIDISGCKTKDDILQRIVYEIARSQETINAARS